MEPNSLQYIRSTSFTHNSTLRDASFSSYLKPTQPENSELSIFDAQKYFNETATTTNLEPKEIRTSVSSTIDERARFSSVSSTTDGYSRNYRVRSFHATPTASSEASWNSQTGLLSNPPGAIKISLKNPVLTDNRSCDDQHGRKGRSSGGTWFFRPRCPCYGRKSVQVCEKKVAEPDLYKNNRQNPELLNKRNSINSIPILKERTEKVLPKSPVSTYINPANTIQKSNNLQQGVLLETVYSKAAGTNTVQKSSNLQQGVLLETVYSKAAGTVMSHGSKGVGGEAFSFPILKKMNVPQIPSHEDPPRESLEVFQPLSEEQISNTSGIVRDERGAAYGFGFVGSPITRKDDDVASDASSDLFEIESFSTNTSGYPMYLRRESLDEATTFNNIRRLALGTNNDEPTTPSVAPTECYEPSEASIDWSVTTAEGFDRASVTNFSSVSACEWDNNGRNHGGWGIMDGGKVIRKANCGLLSCRHEKAVSVGPNPVKCVIEEQPYGSFPLMCSTTRHVSGRVSNSKLPSLITATSHSARLTSGFAPPPLHT